MKYTAAGTLLLHDTPADYTWLAETLAGPRSIGIDVETKTTRKNAKAPDVRADDLVGVGIAIEGPGFGYAGDEILPVYGLNTPGLLAVLTSRLRVLPWYACNAMFDATVLRRYGVRLGKHVGDPRIIAYLLGEPDAGLKSLLARWLNYPTLEYHELLEAYDAEDISQVPVEVQADYCAAQDAMQCILLERAMRPKLSPKSLAVYTEIELPMVEILVEMSEEGIRFDREAAGPMFKQEDDARAGLDAVIAQLVEATGFVEYETRNGEVWNPTCKECRNGKLKRVGCAACGGAGKLPPVRQPFNPGSSDQLRRWLYDHMGAPVRRFAGGRKAWQARQDRAAGLAVGESTDGLALLQLRDFHEIIPMILTRRKFAKRASFLGKALEFSEKDGKLHTEFTNTKVVSGRLSSKRPNLQQVTLDLRGLYTADE